MKPSKYQSRKWLSSDTHSSAYIFSYYNERCKNLSYANFIRIADCHKAVTIDLDRLSKKDIQRFLDRLYDLCNLKIRHFRFKQYVFKIHEDVNFSWLTIDRVCDKKRVNIITLHQDAETCTKLQWRKKLGIIKQEVSKFYNFLVFNKII